MNDAPTPQVPKREQITVRSEVPVLDTGIFEQMLRIARIMATSQLVPEHLNRVAGTKSNPIAISSEEAIANCFLVVNQAVRWSMDPFAVAQHVFVTKGRVGYEGKLVAAVINSHPNLAKRLSYTFTGEAGTPGRGVVVSGRVKGDAEDRTIDGTIKAWKTDNDSWAKIPDQMLTYRGAREWARRWMPEAILGVYAEEELSHSEIDVTREGQTLAPEPGKGGAGDRLREAVAGAVADGGKQTEAQVHQGEKVVPAGDGKAPEDTPPAGVDAPGAAAGPGTGDNPQPVPAHAKEAAGRTGTPRLRKLYLEKIPTITDTDVLNATMDETRSYDWAPEVAKEIQDAYLTRREELDA